MRTVLLLILLLMCASSGRDGLASRDEGLSPSGGLFLPEGNAASGRKVFLERSCHACHRVHNDGMPAPVTDEEGPVLGMNQADYAAGWLMDSILNPLHTIAPEARLRIPVHQVSGMRDYSGDMTVRELADLVVYLQSLSR